MSYSNCSRLMIWAHLVVIFMVFHGWGSLQGSSWIEGGRGARGLLGVIFVGLFVRLLQGILSFFFNWDRSGGNFGIFWYFFTFNTFK